MSALPSWHSGVAFSTVSSAFVAGYANDAPAILVGSPAVVSAHAHKTSGGSINLFADQAAALSSFTGPVGFQIGTRNSLRGPNYVNFDIGVGKEFPILGDSLRLKFRADAFNAFNHASFSNPSDDLSKGERDITSGNFGRITSTVVPARVLQGALRLEF